MASPLDWNPTPAKAPVATPFDATPLGYATNFYKALPTEFGNAAKDIAQGTLQSFISLGNTLLGTVDKGRKGAYQIPASLQPLVGATEVKDLPTKYQELNSRIANSPTAKKYGIDKFSGPIAFGGILGQSILDFAPLGGEAKVAEQLAKTADESVVRSLLKKMGADADIAAKFAPDIAKVRTTAEVEDILHTLKGLHTLKTADRATKARDAIARGESPDVAGMTSREISSRLAERESSILPRDSEIGQQMDKKVMEGLSMYPIPVEGLAHDLIDRDPIGIKQISVLANDEDAVTLRRDARAVLRILSDNIDEDAKIPRLLKLKENLESSDTEKGRIISQTIDNLLPVKSEGVLRSNVTLLSPEEAAQAAEFGAAKRARERRAALPSTPAKATVIRQSPAQNLTPLITGPEGKSWRTLISGYFKNKPASVKAHVLDYFGTPEFVLEKLGLHDGAALLQDAKDLRRTNLKEAIDKILSWKKRAPSPEAAMSIFDHLDGKAKDVHEFMSKEELAVTNEIKDYLKDWAKRLKLPEEHQISEYITHLFESTPVEKGQNPFDDPDLRLVMESTPAKSVYDPFLEKRIGKPGYKRDVWAALDAYVKRGTRKEAFDPALEKLDEEARKLPGTAYQYVTRLTHRINMRPTELDELVDNFITSTPIGHRFTERPTTVLSRKIRTMFYRGTLGLNVSSALRNLSQGANTYAKLGEKYTVYGYVKLFGRLMTNNLKDLYEAGILDEGAIEDKKIGVYKTFLQKLDPLLFSMFDLAEKVNRGAAYYGAHARGIDKGLSAEEAEKYAKRIVRETQFAFGNVDSPVALSSDIVKTVAQLQSYSVKQIEFLSRMAQNKEWGGLIRYTLSALTFVYTIGRMFGMKPDQLLPSVGLGAPSTNLVTGLFGLMNTNEEDRQKAISDLQRSLVTTIPAGAQLRKTIQGLKAYGKGRDETKAGNFRFPVKQDLPTLLQVGLFGKSVTPEAQAYYDRLNGGGSSSGRANPFDL